MIMLARRNLTVFFRDKAAVFFSLLSALIVFGLYIFFLGDLWTSNLESIVNGQEIMDSWLIAGLLTITSFTSAMGAYGSWWKTKQEESQKIFMPARLVGKT